MLWHRFTGWIQSRNAVCCRRGFEQEKNSQKQKELLKKMKENGFSLTRISQLLLLPFPVVSQVDMIPFASFTVSLLAWRKADKDETKRARERIIQKLKTDKVLISRVCSFLSSLFSHPELSWRFMTCICHSSATVGKEAEARTWNIVGEPCTFKRYTAPWRW